MNHHALYSLLQLYGNDDAMYLNFSNYVASKLEVWSSRGKARLEEFLAKMGVGLQQCKQKFPFMSSQLRARLRQQLTKYMEEYGLEDIFYGSFQRFLGFNTPISAADMVYSITALFEQHAEADEDAWLDGYVCVPRQIKFYCFRRLCYIDLYFITHCYIIPFHNFLSFPSSFVFGSIYIFFQYHQI